MAQFAFVQIQDIDGNGPVARPSLDFTFKVIWAGDQLQGQDVLVSTISRGMTQASFATQVQNQIVALAASHGFPSMQTSDIRLIGGVLW